MNIGGIIGGALAAVAGAVVWAAIAYYGKVEIGYLAWGIGLLVGLGVSAGSRNGGVGAALVAVVLTILSLLGGKYAAVYMMVHENDFQLPTLTLSDDDLKMMLAGEQVRSREANGETLKFRNGKSFETVESLGDYPRDIATGAEQQFSSMSVDERNERKEEAQAEFKAAIAGFEAEITQQGFWESFGPIDIIFFLLGIFTAGKVALSDVIDD